MTQPLSEFGDLTIFIEESGQAERRQEIHIKIRAFNDQLSPHHRASRQPDAVQPLTLSVRDSGNRLVGGLTAEIYWNWLEINDLWIEAEHRRGGLGRTLIHLVEEIARRKGCNHAHLKTFSFQARGFYEKQGYRVIGALEDFPPGETFYWLRKELNQEGQESGEQ